MSDKALENWIVEAAFDISFHRFKGTLRSSIAREFGIEPNEKGFLTSPLIEIHRQNIKEYFRSAILNNEQLDLISIPRKYRVVSVINFSKFQELYQGSVHEIIILFSNAELMKNYDLSQTYIRKEIKGLEITTETDPEVERRQIELASKNPCFISIGRGRAVNQHTKIPYNEDRADAFFIEMNHLEISALPQLMAYSVIKLSCQHLEVKNVGSTFVAVACHKNHLITAWVGDSSAFLIAKNEKDETVCHPLTWPHSLTDEREKERLEKFKAFIKKDINGSLRLGGQLAMSRAIGNGQLVPLGLSCLPSMSIMQIPGGYTNPRVLIRSDGADYLDLEMIAEVLKNLKPADDPADAIRAKAYSFRGNTDNMTVMIMPAEQGNVGFLRDGHGGTLVAENTKSFEEIFKERVSPQPQPLTPPYYEEDSEGEEEKKSQTLQPRRSSQSSLIPQPSSQPSSQPSQKSSAIKRKLFIENAGDESIAASDDMEEREEHRSKKPKLSGPGI